MVTFELFLPAEVEWIVPWAWANLPMPPLIFTVENGLPEARLTVNWFASSIEPPIATWPKHTAWGAVVTTHARWMDAVGAVAWCFELPAYPISVMSTADPGGGGVLTFPIGCPDGSVKVLLRLLS